MVAQTRPDSVVYDREGHLYLIHQKDSVGAWRLAKVLSLKEYLKYRETQLLSTDPTPVRSIREVPPKREPQGLSLTTVGEARLRLEQTTIRDGSPMLPVQMRHRSYVGFSYETTLGVQASYGDHIRMDLRYNTHTTLPADRQSVRLAYVGDEYDLVQNVQAGNIQFTSQNPLVALGSDLLGLRSDFRIGPLSLTALAARRHDNERKIRIQGGKRLLPFEVRSSEYQFAQHFFLSEFFARKYDQALSTLPLVTSDLYIRHVELWVTDTRRRSTDHRTADLTAYPEWALMPDTPPSSDTPGSKGHSLHNATRLQESDYTVHPTLGFISLNFPLAERQQLAVVYSYSYKGKDYQVGTFVGESDHLEAALLSGDTKLPSDPLWELMMKNGYSIPYSSRPIEPEDLTLNIYYRTPGTAIDRPTDTGGKPWIEKFALDRTDLSGSSARADGLLDYLPGTLFLRNGGTLFLPFRRPFATIPDEPYTSLYTTTPAQAIEDTELDRFVLRGDLSGGETRSIPLGTTSLAPGDLTVRTPARILSEGLDYSVDYTTGTLTLNTPQAESVEVTIRERELARKKEKTLIGLEAQLQLLPGLSLGGTVLDYTETLPTRRVRLGEEPLHNTLWGMNATYDYRGKRLTDYLDHLLPGRLQKPVALHLEIAYANLKSNYNTPKDQAIVLEDFEQKGRSITLVYPHDWSISGNPFPENSSALDHRARLAWYTVDPLLVRDGVPGQPTSLRDNLPERTNPLVCEVATQALFPGRDPGPAQQQYLSTLNLSYYPQERGPYTAAPYTLDASGHFVSPGESWGSITRPLEVTDFEQEQILYLEGWLLDPYTLDPNTSPGELLIDLGRLSEEVLPDGQLYYEGPGSYTDSDYGRVPTEIADTYTFDQTGAVPLALQDRGLDGLSSEEERRHPLYQALLRHTSDPEVWRDPAADDYRFYLGEEWDRTEATVLERYKYINGTEGNTGGHTIQGIRSAATWEPDKEDLNRNFLLDTEEHYFRYRLPLSPPALTKEHSPYIVGERTYTVDRGAGRQTTVRWIKFRIPLDHPHSEYGSPTLRDVPSVRLVLRGFTAPIHLRWALLRFVSSSWQNYNRPIDPKDTQTASLAVSQLSLEEDSGRKPIPYVSPPGVGQELIFTPMSPMRSDERALALTFDQLHQDQPVAVFYTPRWDLRHYDHLTLHTHLHSEQDLRSGEVELFVRLGSDFTQNYYEIRHPLSLTPLGDYTGYTPSDLRRLVWPDENKLVLTLSELTALKQARDHEGADPGQPYRQGNICLKGYPTLGEVSSVLIGLRSRTGGILSGEVWVNELSVSGTRHLGGDALLTSGTLTLSDLLDLRAEGGYTSAGFTSLTRDSRFTSLEDTRFLALSGQFDLSYLAPTTWQVHAPLRFSTERRSTTPFYSPTHSDLRYDRSRDGEKGMGHHLTSLWHLEDWHLGPIIASGAFYDPSNLHFSYRLHHSDTRSPYLPVSKERRMSTELLYDYRPSPSNSLYLSSSWDRLYRHTLLPGADKAVTLSHWKWDRALRLRYQPIQCLSVGLTGSTTALIEEPMAQAHTANTDQAFSLLSGELLRAIKSLGRTEHYRATTDLTARLPRLQARLLAPLTASATWRTTFDWQRGLRTATVQNGHQASSTASLDGRLAYDLETLFAKDSPFRPKRLSFRAGYQTGSTIPGLGLEARSAMGVPQLYLYQLGWTSGPATLSKAIQDRWLLTDLSSPRQASHYVRQEYEVTCSARLLPGLLLELNLQARNHRHTTLSRKTGTPLRQSGSIRLSSWGLRSLFENSLQRAGHPSTLYDSFVRLYADGQAPEQAFVARYTLSGRLTGGLPGYGTLLPAWLITYDLTQASPLLARHFSTLRLEHRYSGYLEVPAYEQTTKGLSLRTITQVDELSPLAGLKLTTVWGLTIGEQYTLRRSNTLLLASLRLLEQHDTQLRSTLGYTRAFPAPFGVTLPLLGDTQHEISAYLTHTYIRTYLLARNIRTGSSVATQGLDTHLLQASIDYKLSQALTLRAFWEENARRPLTTGLDHPFRMTSYGLMVMLRLQP